MHQTAKTGVLFAIAAYVMWGFAPMYFKLIKQIPAVDILVHRIIWSVLLLLVLVAVARHFGKVKAAFCNMAVMRILLLSGALLGANWGLFIWAVNSDHLLDASLGYYINPLLNMLLGRLFLGEILRPMQKFAVLLALAGVVILVVSYGYLPWIALALAGTFAIYGLLRKMVAVDSIPGLLVESLLMLPFALIYWVWFAGEQSNFASFAQADWSLIGLLVAAGLVTTAPLLCFVAAARRLRYSTMGFFQYIGPSLMFVLAVFLYQEPLHEARVITFAFVWTALAIFTFDSYRQYKLERST